MMKRSEREVGREPVESVSMSSAPSRLPASPPSTPEERGEGFSGVATYVGAGDEAGQGHGTGEHAATVAADTARADEPKRPAPTSIDELAAMIRPRRSVPLGCGGWSGLTGNDGLGWFCEKARGHRGVHRYKKVTWG